MKLAAAAGVANFVTFVNFMPEREDVLRVLARAKVHLFPTVREGFGMVALEALALGTPVVTSDAADNFAQHLVTSGVNGEVCRAEPIFFADAVERVLGQLPRYSAAASDSVGAYDWDALAVAAGKVLRQMKVLMLSPMPPRIDGLADYAHGVRNAYERAGHVVVVVTDVESAGSRGAIRSALAPAVASCAHSDSRTRGAAGCTACAAHHRHLRRPTASALELVVLVGRGDSTFVVATHHEVGRDIAQAGVDRTCLLPANGRLGRSAARPHQAGCCGSHELTACVGPSKVVLAPLAIFDLPSSSCAPVELRRVRHALERHTVVLAVLVSSRFEKGLLELVGGSRCPDRCVAPIWRDSVTTGSRGGRAEASA